MKDKISNGIVILFAFVLGGLSMYYFSSMHRVTVVDNGDGTTQQVVNSCKNCNSTVIMENGSLSAAVEKVYDSVVLIRNYKNDKLAGTGSGFIYKMDDKYAYIMTNHHVVSGGNKWSIVTTKEDDEIFGNVLGSDEYLDLAVIRVDKKNYMNAVTTLPKDKKVNLGDTVFAIGSPMGYEYRNLLVQVYLVEQQVIGLWKFFKQMQQ